MTKTNEDNQTINNNENNILYLSEDEANALGIYEGLIQRVYVDGQEVEVVFVDEHAFIPATEQERKIYHQADELVKKYKNELSVDGANQNINESSYLNSLNVNNENEFTQAQQRKELREQILEDNPQYRNENCNDTSSLFVEEEVEFIYSNNKK